MSAATILETRLTLAAGSMRAFAEATTDHHLLLETIVRGLARAIGGFCAVGLPSSDGQWLETVAAFDEDAEALALIRRIPAIAPIRMDSVHLATRVLQTGETSLTPQVDEALLASRFSNETDKAMARRLQPRSNLLIALRARGRSLGLLNVLTHGADTVPLGPEDVQLAQMLADHAALAISNSQAFDSLQGELQRRRQAEAALSESEARLRQIMEAANEGIWVLDAERRTTFANRRMAELLGGSQTDFISRRAEDFLPESVGVGSEAWLKRRRAGLEENLELRLRRLDGSEFDATVNASPMHQNEKFVGAVYLVTDCTAQKSLEEQLRQSTKLEAVGRLAGGVAHDFNNILSVILSCTRMVLDDLPPAASETTRQDLDQVLKAAERASSLTHQILTFSRKQILRPLVLDANAALRDLEPMVRRLLSEDIQLDLVLDPALGRIKADGGQLQQALINLVVNARDAMPQGGTLVIETANVLLDEDYARTHLETTPGPHVMIAVSDTGTGMDKATQARIFEPFFTTKGPGQGTGLGLSTVFGIVKQSGGSVWVYSEPGRGTTFKLYFPRTDDAPSLLTPAPASRRRLTGSERILLVEDDPALRAIVASILERAGYQVLLGSTPAQALELAAQFEGTIDLLLTDVVMPKMSGKQLADALLKTRPLVRVLYMSGYTENTIVHHGVLDDGVDFLAKPLTPAVLLEKVRQTLGE